MVRISAFIGFILWLATLLSSPVYAQEDVHFGADDFAVSIPDFFVSGVEAEGTLISLNREKLVAAGFEVPVVINGENKILKFRNNKAVFQMVIDRTEPVSIKTGSFSFVRSVTPMPLWLSVLPPLLVIGLALVFKEVISSLILGIISGACIVGWYDASATAAGGFLRVIDTYILNAMVDSGHVSVMVFSTLIGGIVAIISKNGGMQAVVDAMSKKANDARSGQLATWGLGIAIFFDDYANTLVVGNTMRPLTDRLRISREKLSYLVDSTAAPVAAIALITTWIGAELGYIQGAIDTINAKAQLAGDYAGIDQSAYAIFLGSLEYAYYPIYTLAFMLMLILLNRDYGPMHRAEVKARREGIGTQVLRGSVDVTEFEPEKGVRPRMFNAIIPIAIVIFGTMAGLLYTGYDAATWADAGLGFGKKLSLTIGASDSYKALLWASMFGLIVAVLLTAAQRIQTFAETIETSISGFKTMVSALLVLILAWSLASLTAEMHTADYLAGLASGTVVEWAVPAITFVIAALVAFSTGSSWGTMAIVYPLMLPLSWELSMEGGVDVHTALGHFFNVTSCVLAGSVLGDHCSPISDTTILSSLATHCNHIAHVRTQMPYALTVGAVSLTFTLLGAIFEIPWILDFPLGIFVLYLIIRFVGKKVPEPSR